LSHASRRTLVTCALTRTLVTASRGRSAAVESNWVDMRDTRARRGCKRLSVRAQQGFFVLAKEETSNKDHYRTFSVGGRGLQITARMDGVLAKMVEAIAKQDQLGKKHTRTRIEQTLLEALPWSRTTDSMEELVRTVISKLGQESKPFRAFIPFSGLSFKEGVRTVALSVSPPSVDWRIRTKMLSPPPRKGRSPIRASFFRWLQEHCATTYGTVGCYCRGRIPIST